MNGSSNSIQARRCRAILWMPGLILSQIIATGYIRAQSLQSPNAATGAEGIGPLYEPAEPFGGPTADAIGPCEVACGEPWAWQIMPAGLIWHSYMAGVKEPGIRAVLSRDKNGKEFWDFTLGGRVGLIRYGSTDVDQPEGWQFDLEGAAMPRLDVLNGYGLVANDYRYGFPLTYGTGEFRAKLAYYHLCSHLGDQFIVQNPGAAPLRYQRDAVVLGLSRYFCDCLRIYGEVGVAFFVLHGSQPWEFQFGAEYSPVSCNEFCGSPFAAVNVYLRQDVGFRGDTVAQVGWQWRHGVSERRFRVGLQLYDGYSEQRQFFTQREQKIGVGAWYDY